MKPILTVLSYSGGSQSHALEQMVLRGDIEKPEHFIVLNANPGMENSESLVFVDQARKECAAAGIPFITAEGPNLYEDLIGLPTSRKTRIDNPPYWTKNRVTGKRGRLSQSCTQAYKIAPMRRALRAYLNTYFDISLKSKRLPKVEMWIGLSADEQDRISKCKSDVKYIELRFPLNELGMDKAKVAGYYLKNGLQPPPRSVCCACYSNGLAYFEDMHNNRPDDWDKAVAVDDACRDMRKVGIEDEVFVSSSLIPLRDLPDKDFLRGQPERKAHQCNSGACFL